MAKQKHPHTEAARMAGNDIRAAIKTFSDGPGFMQDHADPRTTARRVALANAPADIQALRGTISDAALHAIIKE